MASTPISKLSVKKQKYVKALAEGASKKDAMIAAGYQETSARNPQQVETPDVQAAFRQVMRNRIRTDRIAKRISEGMDAMQTKFFAHNGIVLDSRETIDYQERRHYAQLAAEMAGYWSPKQEVDVTQKLDETTARRLADIAEKIGLTEMEWEARQQLRKSYVVLDAGKAEISDSIDADESEDDGDPGDETPQPVDE